MSGRSCVGGTNSPQPGKTKEERERERDREELPTSHRPRTEEERQKNERETREVGTKTLRRLMGNLLLLVAGLAAVTISLFASLIPAKQD